MTHKAAGSTHRVLIIEDDAEIRALACLILEDAGYAVDQAGDGDEGIARIIKRPYAAIVLDMMMPSVDGFQVLEAIKQMPKRCTTPVVVVTARHDPRSLMRELSGGAVDHLAKPFAADALLAAVARAIEGSDVDERRGTLWRSAEAYDAVGMMRSAVSEHDAAPAPGRRGRR